MQVFADKAGVNEIPPNGNLRLLGRIKINRLEIAGNINGYWIGVVKFQRGGAVVGEVKITDGSPLLASAVRHDQVRIAACQVWNPGKIPAIFGGDVQFVVR